MSKKLAASESIVKKSEETDAPSGGEASEEVKVASDEVINEVETEEISSPINEPIDDKRSFDAALDSSPINIPENPSQIELVTSEVATASPELNQPKVSDQFNLIANINIEQAGAELTGAPAISVGAETASPINEASLVETFFRQYKVEEKIQEDGNIGETQPGLESISTSSFMNVDFSKMSFDEITKSFTTGDIFGETKNEFSNIFGEETVIASPVNEVRVESIPEKKEEEFEVAQAAIASPVNEATVESAPDKKEEVSEVVQAAIASPVNEIKDVSEIAQATVTPTLASSFMNVDFSKMSIDEITKSFMTGDIFGETKNEFINIFGEEMKPKATETTQASETTETGGFLSNIFSREREKGAKETVERGAAKMNAPIVSMTTNAPVSQENSSTNVTTNQSAEANTPAEVVSNQTSNVSNISNDNSDQSTSESMASNRSSMMQGGFDNSDVVNRLRRIERLLSGPLEVKIIES